MSAWIVDREHIRALVDAAVHYGLIENDRAPHALRDEVATAQAEDWAVAGQPTEVTAATLVGRILWAENVKSIEARYPDTVTDPKGRPGPIGDGPGLGAPFVFKARRFHLLPGAVAKAVGCYEYQSCEHDGWKDSGARQFCEALRDAALSRCPGYEECPWGIEDDELDAKQERYGSASTARTKPYCYPADDSISLLDMMKRRK